MNAHKLSPDDPRLTAYALGELDAAERAAIEAALRDDPAARAAVEEIRAMGAQLESALASEPVAKVAEEAPALAPQAKAAIIPGRDPYKLDGGPWWQPGKLVRFPQSYFVIGGLAAACFALMVTLREPPSAAPKKVYREISLAPPAPAAAPAAAEAKADATAPAVAPTSTGNEALARKDLPLLAGMPKFEGAAKQAEASALNQVGAASPMSRDLSSVSITAPGERLVAVAPPPVLNYGSVAPSAALVPPSTGTLTLSSDAGTTMVARSGRGAATLSGTLASSRAAYTFSSGSNITLGATAALRDERYVPPPPTGARFTGNTESYAFARDNDFLGAAQNPLSTFSIDADTASYANVRRFLRNQQRPPRDAVRIEELLNYFPFRYAPPSGDAPFAASIEVAEAPWAPTHRLVRIGLKGREVTTATRPAANLVFLLDVSGSMNAPNRLPLAKEAMRLLVGKLRPDDRVAIVTYAGQSGLALPSTPVAQSREILEALDRLAAGGSTNGAMGIQLAYDIAKANFAAGGINRVILCTDGDFNVGVTSEGELVRLIEEKAKSGVMLTALGFGMGNLKDSTLEKLAGHGNGSYGYVDSRREAERLLVEQVNGTLVTIAKDVKVQVEFNPARVASYRLIGYENRLLKKEDFANDKVDAGEIGAGHTVTALYEVVPVGVKENPVADQPAEDELRYRRPYQVYAGVMETPPLHQAELLAVKVRYKKPDGLISHKLEFPLVDGGAKFANASGDFKFAAAVAGFGMVLRDSPHKGAATLPKVTEWAEAGTGDDPGGYRAEFIELTRDAARVGQ